MAVAVKDEYKSALPEQQNVRDLVMAGLEQIKEGKKKEFNVVCDRLEIKYRNEVIKNSDFV